MADIKDWMATAEPDAEWNQVRSLFTSTQIDLMLLFVLGSKGPHGRRPT